MTDRPDWTALTGMISDVQRAFTGINETQRDMLKVSGTAWSDDRMIKAVVGPRGQLMELEIDPRVYRKPNSKALAADIVSTVRKAVLDANEKARAVLDKTLPSDMRYTNLGGGMDLDRLLGSHDTDIRIKGDDDDE
jgi:DNA-binding protein YbaB